MRHTKFYRNTGLFFVCALATLITGRLLAQEGGTDESSAAAPPDDVTLDAELDEFRDGLFAAFNTTDYQAMVDTYCHPDVICIWEDGTLTHGRQGVVDEFEKLGEIISKMQVDPIVKHRLVSSDGNTVVSAGNLNDTYILTGGENVALHSVWTTTLVKEDGKWLLYSFNGTTNGFDNEVTQMFLRATRYSSLGIGALIGIVVGVVGGLIFAKRRKV